MKEKTCCFTGHRDVPLAERRALIQNIESQVRKLAETGYRYFGVGGAIGFDTLAAKTLLRLREKELPQIRVILVYPFDGFTDYWSEAQKRRYQALLPHFDKVVRAAEKPGKEAYFARNRHLVDCSSYCICYLKENIGGTAYTVEYAKARGLQICNVALTPAQPT